MLSFIDYTASRVVRQRDLLKQIPPKTLPASLIFTLADDNVGVLPQLATGSLHTLMGELRTMAGQAFPRDIGRSANKIPRFTTWPGQVGTPR